MTKRIQNAIDILLDAINTGTLGKGNCTMCAVGNLVRASFEGKDNIMIDGFHINVGSWGDLFNTNEYCGRYIQIGIPPLLIIEIEEVEAIVKSFELTNFSKEELMAIEFAFETNTKIRSNQYKNHNDYFIKCDQIKGLEAVVKVMLDFEEQEDNIQEVFTSRVLQLT